MPRLHSIARYYAIFVCENFRFFDLVLQCYNLICDCEMTIVFFIFSPDGFHRARNEAVTSRRGLLLLATVCNAYW